MKADIVRFYSRLQASSQVLKDGNYWYFTGMQTLTIIAVGDELLRGEVVDTNSSDLARTLRPLGFELTTVQLVGDKEAEIVRALKNSTADLIICTGGLGPTSDDLTRNAIATFTGKPLKFDTAVEAELRAFFERRKRPFAETNLRQAYFPESATQLENPAGTARAFAVKQKDSWIVSLPGVPREIAAIKDKSLLPFLAAQFKLDAAPASAQLKCFGLSESVLAEIIETVPLSPEIHVAYRPIFPEIWISLHAKSSQQKLVDDAAKKLFAAISAKHVYSTSEHSSLAQYVHKLLLKKKLTISFAESCSGGLLAHRLISIPGSSEYLKASLVTYSNIAKEVFVGVPKSLLDEHGAVSAEVAHSMAWGAKHRSGSDIAVSVTGVAGPDGGTEEKPVGTVWIGYLSPTKNETLKFHLPYERNLMREYTTALVFDLIRKDLEGIL